ncbi:MAG: FG-GAP repeat protein, partial [Planctomycetota bacterium]|nr:FG-GAP repeat protein [Planctomycetota bacterium]
AVGAYVKLTEFLGPGAVYLYRYRNNKWSKFRKVVPSDGAPQDAFGFHVALKGKLLVTGSWRDDDAGADSGSAYLYTFPDL